MSNNIRYYLVKGVLTMLGKLPDWFMYHPMLELIYFILYRVVRYRLGVVRGNMRHSSLSSLGKDELRRIERAFYKQLAEVMIDSIMMFGMSRRQYAQRMEIIDLPQLLEQTEGRSYVTMLGHYGFWEYNGVLQLYTDSLILGVYHPLANKLLDQLTKENRSRFGSLPVAMKSLLRSMVECKKRGQNIIVALIADQNSYDGDAYWGDFLGYKTPFFIGGEKVALKFGMPIYYIDVIKADRARYQSRYIMIYDGVEQVEKNEITRRYVAQMEKTILRAPEYWMWSHKRWKRQPPKTN